MFKYRSSSGYFTVQSHLSKLVQQVSPWRHADRINRQNSHQYFVKEWNLGFTKVYWARMKDSISFTLQVVLYLLVLQQNHQLHQWSEGSSPPSLHHHASWEVSSGTSHPNCPYWFKSCPFVCLVTGWCETGHLETSSSNCTQLWKYIILYCKDVLYNLAGFLKKSITVVETVSFEQTPRVLGCWRTWPLSLCSRDRPPVTATAPPQASAGQWTKRGQVRFTLTFPYMVKSLSSRSETSRLEQHVWQSWTGVKTSCSNMTYRPTAGAFFCTGCDRR